MILNDDNLDDQQNTSESSIHPDSTPITQPPPFVTSTMLLERDVAIVRELNVPVDFFFASHNLSKCPQPASEFDNDQ